MQIITPYVSCIASHQDFDKAIKDYSEVYLPTADGYIKHVKLQGDRHARVKVKSLPANVVINTPVKEYTEEINFLPAGKIKYSLFEQIVEFFRQVISVAKIKLEAHAWILWSKETGYYISVPPQTVSGASVKFEYTQEALPDGHIIVVDLHSHNSTGAFYSGTDNNNDKSGIYYSGVIGKLTDDTFEYVLRFNLYEDKVSVDLEDIFEIPKVPTPEVPKEWLDKIKQVTYQGIANRSQTGIQTIDSRYAQRMQKQREQWAEWFPNEENSFGNPSKLDDDIQEGIYTFNARTGCPEKIEATTAPSDYVNGPLDEEDDVNGTGDPEYETLAREYGVDVADAVDTIEGELNELTGNDELLKRVILIAYDLLSPQGQAKLQTEGI